MRWLRVGVGALVVGVLVARLGTGPFLDGLRAVGPVSVVAALVATALTTWCCAKRWAIVSASQGRQIPMRTAYAAYYRSQLVNVAVPGGVAGDVGRGLRHGWRGVLWERGIGQVAQVLLVGALLLPGWWRAPGLLGVALAAGVGGAVVALSLLNTAGHLAVFLVAANAVGADLPLATLVPLGALVLLGAAIPLHVAGWGPREGVAAWAFPAFGAPASLGLAVAVAFGALSVLAVLPGLVALRPATGHPPVGAPA